MEGIDFKTFHTRLENDPEFLKLAIARSNPLADWPDRLDITPQDRTLDKQKPEQKD